MTSIETEAHANGSDVGATACTDRCPFLPAPKTLCQANRQNSDVDHDMQLCLRVESQVRDRESVMIGWDSDTATLAVRRAMVGARFRSWTIKYGDSCHDE